MSTLADQVAAFARERGLTVRHGPAPRKPITAREPSIGRPQPVQSPPKADPWLNYTDDYSVWKQGQ
jgi:hypothetical protein